MRDPSQRRLRAGAYKRHYLREMLAPFHRLVEARCFGSGERIAFLPCTADAYEQTRCWLREHEVGGAVDAVGPYDTVVYT